MNIFRTPLWSLKIHRARLHTALAACSLALSFCALGGCAQKPAAPANAASSSSSSPSWGEVLQNWWRATTDTKTQPAAPAPVTPATSPSQREIAVLAKQHPAWKLADALQQNRLAPLHFEAIAPGAARAGGVLAAPNFDVDFPGDNRPSGSAAGTSLPKPATAKDSSPPLFTTDFDQLQQTARAQQETPLAEFLSSVATRQENWQRDYRAILQIALGEEVEAAAKRAPSAIPLVLPAPEMQLEMTNLRLRLLRNVFTTDTERSAARERLRELMTQWRTALREQESARSRELQRLRSEEPERLRSEGLVRIQQELDLIRRTQQELRSAIAAEHRARLEEDFGNERARLALTFPTMQTNGVPGSNSIVTPTANLQNKLNLEKIIFNRTLLSPRTSNGALPGVAAAQIASGAARTEQIRALRRQAWSDATRQAQMATRLGY